MYKHRLAAMNGQPKDEQRKMHQQMRRNNRLMFKLTKDEVLTAKTRQGTSKFFDSDRVADQPWLVHHRKENTYDAG